MFVELRTAGDPCGKTVGVSCYQDVSTTDGGTGLCVQTCSLPNFYGASSSSGACEVKTCTDRERNESVSQQCGPDISLGVKCYWDPQNSGDGKCKTSCVSDAHFGGNSNNVCELKTPCSSRTSNTSATLRCGSGCVLDGTTCTSACSTFLQADANGVCQPLACGSRTVTGFVDQIFNGCSFG
jgi:hypothetical protein